MNKKLVHFALLAMLGVSTAISPITAYASVDSDIESTTNKLTELQKEEQSAQASLVEIAETIKDNEVKAESLVAEMTATQNQLEELKTKIADLTEAIEDREEKLAMQARSVQTKGNTGNFVEFLLEADNVADALARMDVVSNLVKANKDLVTAQNQDKEAIAKAEKTTEEKLQEQNLLAAELESAKADLEAKKLEKEVVVATIAAEKTDVQEQKEYYLSLKEAAETEVATLTSIDAEIASAVENAGEETVVASTEKASSEASAKPKAEQPTKVTTAPAGGVWATVQNAAYSVSGTPYLYGGNTTSGFDCSGFTTYVFKKAGITLPRTASGQYGASTKVSQSQAQPGDLVFFSQSGGIDHVGIYLGNNKFIGSQSSTGVAVAEISQSYWGKYLVGFGRVN
ncbi:NlpC/P60 family protein [Desemzia incerta]|uniref:C40 family peptidase n=1 Tax=Desemzia incerta TaxID=82801 RepID=UPI0024C346FB|nr:NlpC/P60 family protein [Desemzia incerta]WHZ31052.1 NlpC/P60 family protein [Desemzia incerta]